VRALAAIALAAALLGAGCGSGGDGGSRSRQSAAGDDVVLGRTGAKAPPPRDPAPAKPAPKPKPAASRPAIVSRPIPFPQKRLDETAAYARRHYGRAETTFRPGVIVEHFTVTPTFQATFNTFAADVPDTELHELPATCSQYVVDRDGTIYQLVPTTRICRHTVGLNDVAIGIEHVGSSDAQVLADAAQLAASQRLTSWLRCRYGIAVKNVIGHAESLSSPFHHENVPALRSQTHADFQPAAMDRYRRLLARRSC
jgi:N-acetylmuramoyl-L-alanine amidase